MAAISSRGSTPDPRRSTSGPAISARLREVACGVWENLFERRLQDSDVDVAIEAGTRLVALDPLREQSQRRLLQAYAQAGRRAEALQHFQNFSARLRSELDVEPDQETLRLVADIRAAPARPADRTSDPSTAVPDAHAATRRRRWLLPAGVIGAALAGFVLWAVLFDGGIFAPNRSTVQELTVPARDRPSIAVLPFDNLSGDSAQEYFADGITEDITAGLAKFGHVLVVSRNSAFSYKGVSVNVTDVARDLRVQYVLEGSVRRAGDQVRITVQLIDAVADKHVWAEKYDRTFQDVFAIQDEITQNIVAAVAPEYLSAEMRRSQQAPPRNLSAWDSFMRGYWHLLRFTRNDNTTAQRHLHEAIALDPHQSHYYGLLSVTYTMDGLYGWSGDRARAFDMALKHAERGLALDGQDSLSIRAAGLVHFFSKNHDVALDYYRRAVDANPDEAENRALLGAALGVAGDYDGAVEQFQTAFALSPRDVHVATWYNYLAVAAFVAGRDAAALGWAKKTVQANPKFPGGHRTFAASYGVLGRFEEAKTAGEALLQLMPHLTLAQMRESLPYFKEPQDLERYLDGLRASGVPD